MVKESFFVTSNNLSKINVAAKSAFHYTSENFEVNSRWVCVPCGKSGGGWRLFAEEDTAVGS